SAAESGTAAGAGLVVFRLVRAVKESDQSTGEHDGADQQHSQSIRPRLIVGAIHPRPPPHRRGVVGLESATHLRKSCCRGAAERMAVDRMSSPPVGKPAGV